MFKPLMVLVMRAGWVDVKLGGGGIYILFIKNYVRYAIMAEKTNLYRL